MIKKMILILSFLVSSFSTMAGHETGNGGDTHLSRYLMAQQIAEVMTRKVSREKIKQIFTNQDLYSIVSRSISAWPNVISNLEFISVDTMLFENGKEKVAISVPHSNVVKISKAYFEKYNLSLEEVVVNVIHESGHKLGISDHHKLDTIGSIFVNEIYKYSFQRDSWEKYLNIESSIQNQFDKRLKNVALEYVRNGEGLELAKVLYYFAKNSGLSNLSEMFKYIAMAKFGENVREYIFKGDYWAFYNRATDRFIRELILFSKTVSRNEFDSLVKYAMAKLKISGVYYCESISEFDKVADGLTSILLNNNLTIEERIALFKAKLSNNFYFFI